MVINKIKGIYFSPNGKTKLIVEYISKYIADELKLNLELIDFTIKRENTYKYSFEDIVIFGVPTYAGRVPNKILPSIRKLFKGEGTMVIPVVTFGNRNFDESLLELEKELTNNGFKVIAAAAFATQHSFSKKIGTNRPDIDDIKEIKIFSQKILEKIRKSNSIEDMLLEYEKRDVGSYYTPLKIDGKPAKFLKAKPITNLNLCDECGLCAKKCPMGAIDNKDFKKIINICIKCYACINICHTKAKYFNDSDLISHIKMLEQNYKRRAYNKIYL